MRFFFMVLTAHRHDRLGDHPLHAAHAEDARSEIRSRLPGTSPSAIVLIIIGALFEGMAAVLWVITVLSNLAVNQRMIYTWREATRLEDAQLRAGLILQNHIGHPPNSAVCVSDQGNVAGRVFRPRAPPLRAGAASAFPKAGWPPRNPATARRASSPCRWPSCRPLWRRSAPRRAPSGWPCAPRMRFPPACKCVQ